MPELVVIIIGSLIGAVNILFGFLYNALRSDVKRVADALVKVTDQLTAERLANATLRERVENLNAEILRQAGHIETLLSESRGTVLDMDQRHHDTLRGMLSTTSEAQLEAIRLRRIMHPDQ